MRLKTLNWRHFKCVSHPLVFYITAITRLHTDNVKYFGNAIVTCIQSTILSLSWKSIKVLSMSSFRNIYLTIIFYKIYFFRRRWFPAHHRDSLVFYSFLLITYLNWVAYINKTYIKKGKTLMIPKLISLQIGQDPSSHPSSHLNTPGSNFNSLFQNEWCEVTVLPGKQIKEESLCSKRF